MSKYLLVDEIIEIHKVLIEEFGGTPGLRDIGTLESALMRPQSGYYQNIFEEAAALMESLANNHPFLDGNKRVAFFAADIFLRLNGYFINCDNDEAHTFFMNLFDTESFKYSNLLKWLDKKVASLEKEGGL
jgi:death-on-curing protein